jgi:hypothetical protein
MATVFTRFAEGPVSEILRKAGRPLAGGARSTVVMLVATLGLALLGSMPAVEPAFARQVCGDRSSILEKLSGRYAEKPHAMGVTSDGKLIEILVSSRGSWTILISTPDKRSCLAAAGEHWETVRKSELGPPV